MLTVIPFEVDDGLERRAVETALAAALDCLLADDDIQKGLSQDLLLNLSRDAGQTLTLVERVDATTQRTETKVDDLTSQVAALTALLAKSGKTKRAKASGITDKALIGLAQRIAENVPDAASAFRELENAVEIAIRVQAEGRVASNHGDFVDTVLARVAELARDGRYDAASADIDAALAQEQAESAARTIRLLDAGIEQDTLRRNAPAVADRLLRKAQVEDRGGFDDLRVLRREWYERGRDKGLNFDLAVSIALAHLTHSSASTPDQRGRALNDLGTALANLGRRESGTARMEQAVAAYRAAVEEVTRESFPLDWAMTQMNLGNALATLGKRESGTVRLEQAVTVYLAALEEMTRDRAPLDWARVQSNLGIVLKSLGERESGTARLEQAVAAYGAALEEWSRDKVPMSWAGAQMNRGNALHAWGRRESGTARLEQAVAAYGAALEEWTRDRVPLDWANALGNQGLTLRILADRTRDVGQARQALDQLRQAEAVLRDGGHAPWAATFAKAIPVAEALVATLADGTT